MSVQWGAQIISMFKRSPSQFIYRKMFKSWVINSLPPGTHIMFVSKLRVLPFSFYMNENVYLPSTFLYSVIKSTACCKRCWFTIIAKNENLYQVRTPLNDKLSSPQSNNLPDVVRDTDRQTIFGVHCHLVHTSVSKCLAIQDVVAIGFPIIRVVDKSILNVSKHWLLSL
jgi:hypothetical protein